MSREYRILWAGRHQRDAWETLCADYRKRLRRWVSVEDQPVKVRARGDDASRQRAEGAALLAATPQPAWGIALDARGESMSSVQLARHLRRLKREWPHPLVFYLGSDLGLDEAVLEGSRQVLSFGPMTLRHELARLVLYEQLYRALSIDAGIKYHRGQS